MFRTGELSQLDDAARLLAERGLEFEIRENEIGTLYVPQTEWFILVALGNAAEAEATLSTLPPDLLEEVPVEETGAPSAPSAHKLRFEGAGIGSLLLAIAAAIALFRYTQGKWTPW